MNDHYKKTIHYLIKSDVKLVFKGNQDCKYLITGMINITRNISWSTYLREVIDNSKEEGYHFNHIAEMDVITLAHKRDMFYDFSLKQNMSAFEWKLNAMTNKDKNLIDKLPQNWRHPINTNFDCYRNNNV